MPLTFWRGVCVLACAFPGPLLPVLPGIGEAALLLCRSGYSGTAHECAVLATCSQCACLALCGTVLPRRLPQAASRFGPVVAATSGLWGVPPSLATVALLRRDRPLHAALSAVAYVVGRYMRHRSVLAAAAQWGWP